MPITRQFNLEHLTPREAEIIIQLPRSLGASASGEEIKANVGRFGPYVQRGKDYRSIPADMDLFAITLEQAEALFLQEKKSRRPRAEILVELGADPVSGKPVQILLGRYGPYVSNGTRVFASAPKDRDPKQVTLSEALALLEAKKNQPRRRKKRSP